MYRMQACSIMKVFIIYENLTYSTMEPGSNGGYKDMAGLE